MLDFITDDDVYETVEGIQVHDNHDRREMKIARIYERVIVKLRLSLTTSGMGGDG